VNASEFQQLVLKMIKADFPALEPTPVRGSPLKISTSFGEFFLSNLRKRAAHHQFTAAELRKEVRQFMLAGIKEGHLAASGLSFRQARSSVLPRIAPYPTPASRMSIVDVIAPCLNLVLVLDFQRSLRYITTQDLRTRGKEDNEQELYRLALSNLSQRTSDEKTESEPVHPSGKLISIDAPDGYAAARILLPGWRRRIGEKLGFPFWFGIPVRDLLLCWSDDVTRDSLIELCTTVRAVHQELDHPLVPFIYRVQSNLGIALEAVIGRKAKRSGGEHGSSVAPENSGFRKIGSARN